MSNQPYSKRLYDVILQHELNPKDLKELTLATVIDHTSVMRYIVNTQQAHIKDVRGLPSVVAPFNTTFNEMYLGRGVRLGWLIRCWDLQNKEHQLESGLDETWLGGLARWSITGYFYLEQFPDKPHVGITAALDHEGKLVKLQDHGVKPHVSTEYIIRPFEDGLFGTESDPYGSWVLPVAISFNAVMWGFCFMHTKNIIKEELEPPEALNKRHEKRYKLPLTRYTVIRVNPDRQIKKGAYKGGEHSDQAEHTFRAHWKEYTEDSPLFGKYTGRWFWNAKTRGKPDNGKVIKNKYQIDKD